MDAFNLTQNLWTFAASALGALIAGYYGVRFGLIKFRKERAFDRRLKWYEEMITAIKVLVNRHSAFLYFLERENKDLTFQVLGDLNKLAFRMQETAALADLYATPETADVIREMVNMLNSYVDVLSDDSDDSEMRERKRKADLKSMGVMEKASQFLTRDVRNHLGLEPLDWHEDLPRFRPSGPDRFWHRVRHGMTWRSEGEEEGAAK